MKKILVIATMAATLSGLSAFGQGTFIFGSSAGWVWDNYSGVTPVRNANQKVGFLFGTGAGLLSAIKGNVETNAVALGANQGWATPSTASAWNAILNDANNVLARNNSDNSLVIGVTTATGGISYNLGGVFAVAGTAVGGGVTQVRIVAWDGQYATPALAAAANSAVGWGASFAYTYGNATGTPANFSSQAGASNGAARAGVFVAVPEPTSFALAGLGIAAMLVSRRRK